MKANKKTLPGVAVLILLLNSFSLALRYISTYHTDISIFSEISGRFTTLAETALPLIAAAAMLAVYAAGGHLRLPLLHALIYSLSWFITFFSEYLILHVYSGYEITYSLLISALLGLLMAAATYAELTVLFFIIVFASRIFASRRYGAGSNIEKFILLDSAFDFSNPVAVGIFSASSALFFYNLGIEIANTVNYISSCAGIYTASEIFYLVFKYVYILALLLLSHLIAFRLKSVFIKESAEPETENNS